MESEECSDICSKDRGENRRLSHYLLRIDEGEIARIATAPSMRRQGAAGQMFQELVAFCEEQQITRIMLEVREGNKAARRFYEKCGFTEDGIRKNYYENPQENAILMSKNL